MRSTGSVDWEMSGHQAVFEDAAATVGKMTLAGKALKRALERFGFAPGSGRHVLREVVAEPAAGHKDRLETAGAGDCGERLGHWPDVRVDRKIGPVAGEAAAGGKRVQASAPEHLVALGRAGGPVEVDEDRVELYRRPG